MQTLKQFCLATSLTIILASAALADCPVPGEVNNPPCTSTQQLTDDPADQTATTTTATVSSEVEIVVVNTLIAGLEDLLTVY